MKRGAPMSLQSNLALLTTKDTDPPEIFRSVTPAHQAQRGYTNAPPKRPHFRESVTTTGLQPESPLSANYQKIRIS